MTDYSKFREIFSENVDPNDDQIDEYNFNDIEVEFSKDYRKFEEIFSKDYLIFTDDEKLQFREFKRDLRRTISDLDRHLNLMIKVNSQHRILRQNRDTLNKMSSDEVLDLIKELNSLFKIKKHKESKKQ